MSPFLHPSTITKSFQGPLSSSKFASFDPPRKAMSSYLSTTSKTFVKNPLPIIEIFSRVFSSKNPLTIAQQPVNNIGALIIYI
jgi:hypothetical protein